MNESTVPEIVRSPENLGSHEIAVLSVRDVVGRAIAVGEVMRSVMKVDVHYGIIPGTDKPSLWKPGAEKVLMLFQLSTDYVIEDLSTRDCNRFRVVCRVTHIPSGAYIGAGVGEASTAEEKYQWRAAICDEEYDATPPDRRKTKWYKRYDKASRTKVADSKKMIRTEPADLANTVLKMAKKRALIDAALTTGACSDLFSQDLEALRDLGFEPDGEDAGRSAEEPKAEPKATMPWEGRTFSEAVLKKGATQEALGFGKHAKDPSKQ